MDVGDIGVVLRVAAREAADILVEILVWRLLV